MACTNETMKCWMKCLWLHRKAYVSCDSIVQWQQCGTVGTSFEHLLLELMVKTGREEKQIPEQHNSCHKGVPAITVVIGVGWSK